MSEVEAGRFASGIRFEVAGEVDVVEVEVDPEGAGERETLGRVRFVEAEAEEEEDVRRWSGWLKRLEVVDEEEEEKEGTGECRGGGARRSVSGRERVVRCWINL